MIRERVINSSRGIPNRNENSVSLLLETFYKVDARNLPKVLTRKLTVANSHSLRLSTKREITSQLAGSQVAKFSIKMVSF